MLSTPKPTVAIVGRPNVGKSTLFNRLVGRRAAIESEVAGTTRDRVIGETEWSGKSFVLVDTGGLDRFPETDLWQGVSRQIGIALDDADVIVMVTDAEAGLTAPDRDAADSLRAVGKPIVLAVNKADNPRREALALEFLRARPRRPRPTERVPQRRRGRADGARGRDGPGNPPTTPRRTPTCGSPSWAAPTSASPCC